MPTGSLPNSFGGLSAACDRMLWGQRTIGYQEDSIRASGVWVRLLKGQMSVEDPASMTLKWDTKSGGSAIFQLWAYWDTLGSVQYNPTASDTGCLSVGDILVEYNKPEFQSNL